MSNTTRLIMIWGGAIILYLILSNSRGFAVGVSSLGQFVNGTTKTLQAR